MCFIGVENRFNMTIVDAYPKLLGIGIDEKAAIVVTGDRFRVMAKAASRSTTTRSTETTATTGSTPETFSISVPDQKKLRAPVNRHFAGKRFVMKSATRLADGGLRLAKTAIT